MLIDDLIEFVSEYVDPNRFTECYPYNEAFLMTRQNGVIINANGIKDYLLAASSPEGYLAETYISSRLYKVIPPSDRCWVEWSMEGYKIGTLVTYGNYDWDIISNEPNPYQHLRDNVPATMFRLNSFSNEGRYIVFIPMESWGFLDSDGQLIFNPKGGICLTRSTSKNFNDSEREANDEAMHVHTAMTLFTFSMLNVKNIVPVEHKPDRKLQDRRKKRGQLPLVKYYTLEVEVPGKRVIGSTHADPSETGSRPLHLVRGHLADYRDGKGLFGKYKGVYWVPAHMRGDIDNGVIKKRYKVTTKG